MESHKVKVESHISLKSGQSALVKFQVGQANAISGEQPLISVRITVWSLPRRSLVPCWNSAKPTNLKLMSDPTDSKSHDNRWVGITVSGYICFSTSPTNFLPLLLDS